MTTKTIKLAALALVAAFGVRAEVGETWTADDDSSYQCQTISENQNTARITKYVGSETDITIPQVLQNGGVNYTITTIGCEAFRNNTKITKVSMPHVVKIEDGQENGDYHYGAFSGCSSLNEILMPCVTNIGASAFYGLRHVTKLEMPNVQHIGHSAFRSFISDVGAKFDLVLTNLASMSENAFRAANAIQSVDFPRLEIIPAYAFEKNFGLISASIPKAKEIGVNGFAGCRALKTVVLPRVRNVWVNGFGQESGENKVCSSLQTVYLPMATNFCDNAFLKATIGTNFKYPYCMESNYYDPGDSTKGAFAGATFNGGKSGQCYYVHQYSPLAGKTAMEQKAGRSSPAVCVYGGLWRDGQGRVWIYDDRDTSDYSWTNEVTIVAVRTEAGDLVSGAVTVPKRFTIGDDASGKTNFTVKAIADCAFWENTGLTGVKIPQGVTNVGYSAFADCPNLIIKVPQNAKELKEALIAEYGRRCVRSGGLMIIVK